MASISTPKTPIDPLLLAFIQALARRQARIDAAEEAAAAAAVPAGDTPGAYHDSIPRDPDGI